MHDQRSAYGPIPMPAWMAQRSRSCGAMRNYVKLTILVAASLLLGYTVSLLQVDNYSNLPLPHTFGLPDTSLHQVAADAEAPNSAGQVDHSLDIAQHERLQPGTKPSIYNQVTSTLSGISSWTKSSFSKLTASASFITPGLEGAPTSEGEQVWGDDAPVHGDQPRIGKVSIVFGDNQIYNRALRTHTAHNRLHNYQMFTLRHSILDDVWTKPAYILSIILRELTRPESERLKWLVWVDADTIILNPNVPLDLFLPPETDEWSHVHMLATYDFNGLNNGVFPIRVHPWSVELLSAIVAFRQYRPKSDLTFRDQSAMAELFEEPRFKAHVMRAPQRWYNAYQGELNETLAPYQYRRGDFLVHFAGDTSRNEHMMTWLERAEMHDSSWEIGLQQTTYPQEVREFWQEASAKRAERAALVEAAKLRLDNLADKVEAALVKYESQLDADVVKHIRERLTETKDIASNKGDGEVEPKTFDGAAKQFEIDAAPVLEHADDVLHTLMKEAHSVFFDGEHLLFGVTAENGASPEVEKLTVHVVKLKEELQRVPVQPEQLKAATAQLAATVREAAAAFEADKSQALSSQHKDDQASSSTPVVASTRAAPEASAATSGTVPVITDAGNEPS